MKGSRRGYYDRDLAGVCRLFLPWSSGLLPGFQPEENSDSFYCPRNPGYFVLTLFGLAPCYVLKTLFAHLVASRPNEMIVAMFREYLSKLKGPCRLIYLVRILF
jgi:hypothetical protein